MVTVAHRHGRKPTVRPMVRLGDIPTKSPAKRPRADGGGTSSGQRTSQRHEPYNPRTCEFARGMVGSAGTCQPAAAARRSQARRRARPAYDAGVHLRPRLGPANSLSAARVRGRRAMTENRAVLPPDDGQAAADDARPRKLGRAGRDRERTPCRAQQKRAEGSVGRRQVVWC